MTAIEPNTVLGIDGDTWEFELDFNGNVGGSSTANLVSDSDTITSAASEVTLRPGRGPGFEQGARDKKLNPGPPYASGDIISCNSCSPLATHGLQRAYMLSADHPNYCLQLEEGVTIDTHTGETWMTPRYIPGVFAPDQDDPFKEALKRGDVKVGSYGMHIDAQLDALQKIREEAKEFAKAIKADNAAVPKRLWDDRMRSGGSGQDTRDKVFALLCRAMHQRLLRLLRLDCCRYTKETHGRRRGHWSKALRLTKEGRPTEVKLDRRAITNVLWHNVHTNWFEFNAGSRLVHFCFPKIYRTMACDGVPVWFGRPGPNTRDAQKTITDPDLRAKAKEKIAKVLRRRYLVTAGIKIKSLVKYFAVPKGEDDVQMVYNATANKLNDNVWVPLFYLSTIDSPTRAVDGPSWMTDHDVGDLFFNYQLHRDVVPYTGVDLYSLYESKDDVGPGWAVCDRNLMGFAASPYNSIKMALVAEEVCQGNRHEQGVKADGRELNPFQWESVWLNLPGSKGYDPCVSWISKLRADGRVACNLFTFVDDKRVTAGPDEDLTWQASHTWPLSRAIWASRMPQGRPGRAAEHLGPGLEQSCTYWPHWGSVCLPPLRSGERRKPFSQNGGHYLIVTQGQAFTFAQGVAVGPGLPCLPHKDLPRNGAVLEGFSSHH